MYDFSTIGAIIGMAIAIILIKSLSLIIRIKKRTTSIPIIAKVYACIKGTSLFANCIGSAKSSTKNIRLGAASNFAGI